jgi:glycine/D-amino acid oxidase-like deaminating enzyme
MLDTVHARFEQWKSLGRPVEWLDRVEIAKVMGCERFVGGWIDRSGGGIHPLKYLFGLGLAVRDLGGSVYSETPVTGFQRSDGKWRVKTSRGEVLAETLLICANVSTGQLDASAGASLMPAQIYQMATKPLSKADSERLTPGRQPVSDVQNDVFTFRIDADNRLITGGMPIFPWDDGPGMGSRMARRLASELDLNEVPQVEKLWTGVAAVTTDFLPGIRQIGPGAFSGVACNARGIASTHVLGNDLAALALKGDAARDLTAIPVREIAAAPFRRLAPLATRSWLWLGRSRDRILARNAKTKIGNCRHVE